MICLLVPVLFFTACGDDDEPTPDTTIVGQLAADPDYSLLVAAVQKAGLVSVLQDASARFTVFAPNNAAFEAAGLNSAAIAALPDGDANLTRILLYHVLGQELNSTQLASQTYTTASAAGDFNLLYVNVASGVKINGAVTVTEANIEASNGVIHGVDSVISLPADIATTATNAGFSILVAALTRSGIDLSTLPGPLTVFAPTDAAFEAAGLTLTVVNNTAPEVLAAVLSYHVVTGGRTFSDDLVSDIAVEAADGNGLYFGIGTAGVFVNEAQITGTDILTTDGVIHVVDRVIGQGTITDLVVRNPEFASLLGVVGVADADPDIDIAGTLAADGPFTLFAPDNAAVSALLTELGVTNLSGFTTDEVATILTYHVLGAEVFSDDVPNGDVETVAGQNITTAVNMMSGAVTITDAEERVTNVTSVNINMSNGVVHVIDRVLLPELP
ncbi:MAG: hypothetical protein OHK0053_11180 [Microscillaceae bacterium]